VTAAAIAIVASWRLLSPPEPADDSDLAEISVLPLRFQLDLRTTPIASKSASISALAAFYQFGSQPGKWKSGLKLIMKDSVIYKNEIVICVAAIGLDEARGPAMGFSPKSAWIGNAKRWWQSSFATVTHRTVRISTIGSRRWESPGRALSDDGTRGQPAATRRGASAPIVEAMRETLRPFLTDHGVMMEPETRS